MIHYHGTPTSGGHLADAKFLTGRHALVSFHHPASIAAASEFCQSFILDNGAFSFWRSGKGSVNVSAYLGWVKEYSLHPGFDWCLIPDKIDGSESDNRALYIDWIAETNIPSVPIWHLHESLEWLEQLVAESRIVAFGSSGQWSHPGTSGWWHRISEALNVVCDDAGRPQARLHGLRMLDPLIFQYIPFSSADSTNAAVNAGSLDRFGMYKPATPGQRAQVIADRIESFNSPPLWTGQVQMAINL